jgi:hypothetical protein
MRNQLEKHFQCKRCHKHVCQTNQEHENPICEKHIKISIDKLRNQEQIVPQSVHKSDIIQCEVVIYLDDAGTKHFTLLVISKSHILL